VYQRIFSFGLSLAMPIARRRIIGIEVYLRSDGCLLIYANLPDQTELEIRGKVEKNPLTEQTVTMLNGEGVSTSLILKNGDPLPSKGLLTVWIEMLPFRQSDRVQRRIGTYGEYLAGHMILEVPPLRGGDGTIYSPTFKKIEVGFEFQL
jgi:hypothetical protein